MKAAWWDPDGTMFGMCPMVVQAEDGYQERCTFAVGHEGWHSFGPQIVEWVDHQPARTVDGRP